MNKFSLYIVFFSFPLFFFFVGGGLFFGGGGGQKRVLPPHFLDWGAAPPPLPPHPPAHFGAYAMDLTENRENSSVYKWSLWCFRLNIW